MAITDTSERGLERLICTALTGDPCDPGRNGAAGVAHPGYGGVGWSCGSPHDYDREFCVDRVQLAAFLHTTQPEAAEALALDSDGPTQRKFLARLQGEVSKRGTIEVLRHGVRHDAHDLVLFYGTPSAANPQARERFEQNRFTAVRQLRYSRDETQRSLDIVLFINGLPVLTFELKNRLTKQTVGDAEEQYKRDRNPRERLFELGRCVVHFAVDDNEVRFCTHLAGKKSWFLPFNRGWNDGAGNPPNPNGIKTDYLWREVLTRESLTNILENYAQVVEEKDEKTGRKKRKQIWPRYHQIDAVRRLLSYAAENGVGRRYLIQQVLSETGQEVEEETFEDRINRLMESRKLLPNASYFAFTATPKNKTLEIFGQPDPQPDGSVRHYAFHSYTMKQAIQEGFILDVMAHYTPVKSYYRLAKTIEDDPEFDATKAKKKLHRFVEGHEHALRLKAEIMVDHFHEQVLAQHKIGGQARAMVVTNGVQRAIQYFHAIRDYLQERKSPYHAIVAFSGEREYGVAKVTETSLNGFPDGQTAAKFREDPYRFLICADKFQTGYDEPLLHTMYVDKTLSGIKAVQTLSRLNRAHPKKHDVFVLDFLNDAETIRYAFTDYYRTTILADETDPNKLHDLQADLDSAQVYSPGQLHDFVQRYLGDADRDELDPILDACVAVYLEELDEDRQVDFKGKAKAFVRTYAFLSCILPFTNAGWEKRSIFLNFLVPKLPAPVEDDLSKGILDAIDMDSYRVERLAVQKIVISDEDGEIDPAGTGDGGHRPDPELDWLSHILKDFNHLFGDIDWQDGDRVRRLITETIPSRVADDTAFKNARTNSDEQNVRIEHGKALQRVMTALMKDDMELFKQFQDNRDFKRWMSDTVYRLACDQAVLP